MAPHPPPNPAVRAMTPGKKGHRPEPLLSILAGEASLEHLFELSTGVVVHPGVVVPYLDRLMVQTFVFDGADRVFSSSKARTFRGRLRRAIQVRDRHCQHPAVCDAPINECDVDHVNPYCEGGDTSEQGGRLQCEAHNRKSDLHHRAPPGLSPFKLARERRRDEELARARLDAVIDDQANRPPPAA